MNFDRAFYAWNIGASVTLVLFLIVHTIDLCAWALSKKRRLAHPGALVVGFNYILRCALVWYFVWPLFAFNFIQYVPIALNRALELIARLCTTRGNNQQGPGDKL